MDLKENFDPNILTCHRLNAAKSAVGKGNWRRARQFFLFFQRSFFIEQRPPDPSRAWRLSDKHS